MRKLAVCADFVGASYTEEIARAAAACGFSTDFYPNDRALAPFADCYEVIFGHPDPAIVKTAAKLRWLCSDFAGIEKYLPDEIWPREDCLLSNSSGAYGPTISEHIVMVLLMLCKRMPEYSRDLALRQWTRYEPIRSITGSRTVLLGTGDIGTHTARRLKALGAEVVGVNRTGRVSDPAYDEVYPLEKLEQVLPTADALISSLPATPATLGLLTAHRLALLPRHCFFINVGRGSTVDQQALVDALCAGRLAGAALDVMVPEPLPTDHPLWSCPNTIITPHTSGNMSLGLTCRLATEMFLADLKRYSRGEALQNAVDRTVGY